MRFHILHGIITGYGTNSFSRNLVEGVHGIHNPVSTVEKGGSLSCTVLI
jgi:hypothetical protein